MPLEAYPAQRIQMRAFASHSEFNRWAKEKGKHIRLVYLSNTPNRDGWRILATYVESERVNSAAGPT